MSARPIEQGISIDGNLDDPAWKGALWVSEFYQKEPLEGQEATEQTRVSILYDQGYLYLGVELQESDPGGIRASELRRDSSLEADDSFAVILDTFHDHRNAFVFRVNPQGTRFDGLIRDENSHVNADWDEQWTAAAVMTEEGWTAEMSIPFKILRFSGAEDQTWGINFERVIKRKNEFVYWSGWDRDFQFHHVSQAGHLDGLRGIKQVERLRIRPYVLAGVERFGATSSPGTSGLAEVGIDDLKFAITSNLTADLTLNPDFGQVEVDDERVNLTRFSLFFSEKRQFFIEGADSLRMRVALLHFGPPPLELFYSRRIGLSERGDPISIIGGGKVTGKVGGFDLGVLSVQTEDFQDQPGQNFSVARVRKEVLDRSYVGAIFTSREGGGSNQVAGFDGNFVLKEHLTVAGLWARSSDSDTRDNQWARQIGARWIDDFLEAGINYLDIDPEFDPGVGFVRRRDRMIGTEFSVKPRPSSEMIRQFVITPALVYFHNDEGVLRTRRTELQFVTSLESGDRLSFDFGNRVERLFRPFSIDPTVTLPVGLYQWNAGGVSFRSFNGRKFSGSAGVDFGDFYDGTKRSLDLAADFRPNPNIHLSPGYEFNDVDLLGGSFSTHLVGLRANVSFSNNLLTSTFIQYNSSGSLAALQFRFNYIFRTIDNLHIVYNETRFTEGVYSGESDRSLVVKLTYSVHR
ncbi:MAG: DUF5916 domain-containing protein [Acidobacteriota bacterium]